MLNHHLRLVTALLAVCGFTSLLPAVTLKVEDKRIDGGPGQFVPIYAYGDVEISGVRLTIQLGDGGIFAGGTDQPYVTVPALQGIDFLMGDYPWEQSIWVDLPAIHRVDILDPIIATGEFLLTVGTVNPGPEGSVIAWLIMDSSGLPIGTQLTVNLEIPYYQQKSFLFGPTYTTTIHPELVPGVLTRSSPEVPPPPDEPPEPAGILLMLIGLPLLGRRTRVFHRTTA